MYSYKPVIKNLLFLFQEQRRSGSTTVAIKAASMQNSYILFGNEEQGVKALCNSNIHWNQHLDQDKIKVLSASSTNSSTGGYNRPIIVDNSAMLTILKESLNQFRSYEMEAKRLNNIIDRHQNGTERRKQEEKYQLLLNGIPAQINFYISLTLFLSFYFVMFVFLLIAFFNI